MRSLIFLCTILCFARGFAGDMGETSSVYHWQSLVGLSVGPTWGSGNETQTFYLQPDIQNRYVANNVARTFTTAEIFLGWQKPLSTHSLGQIGFAVAWSGIPQLTGEIWEDADPDFNNFNYSYKVDHTYLAIKGRLLGNADRYIEPYVSGSIGIGINHAYAYTATPKLSQAVPAPGFAPNTVASFSYTVAAGIQKALSTHVQFAIGYEFADWGTNELAAAPGQTLNKGLTLNHLYAQQLQFSLFYQV